MSNNLENSIPLAVEYYTNGSNFRASAEKLAETLQLDANSKPTKLTAVPLFFLASHAAELFLKAALVKRGFSESDLRKFDYRHNLSSLLVALVEKGVPVTEKTSAVINSLSDQHQNHHLRYTRIFTGDGKMSWPPLPLLFSSLDELLLLCRISTHGV